MLLSVILKSGLNCFVEFRVICFYENESVDEETMLS